MNSISVMNSTFLNRVFLVPVFLILALFTPDPAMALTVDAQLNRETIQLGESAMLRIRISSDSRATVELPEIDGLSFIPRGSSTEVRIANGALSTTKSLSYEIIPSREGKFNISPITVHTKGKKTEPKAKLVLNVGPGRRPPGVLPGQPRPGGAPPAPPLAEPSTVGKEMAFLDVVGLKEQAVVGELIPVEIRAYFRSGTRVSLRSLPSLDGSAFTLKIQDRNPRQQLATVGGRPYTVLIFRGALSPIKVGEFKLPFKMDATMIVRDQSRNRRPRLRSPFGNPFDDPFFDDFFGTMVEKDVNLVSEPAKIKVDDPPTAGRPAGFDGAVGRFSVTSSASDSTVRAGDPVTLTVRVVGEGNFDRLRMPRMTASSEWKTYPPKQHMVKDDSIGAKGTKIFEQTIIPRNESVTEIPAVELAYYDPATRKYKTARTDPIPIKVTPGPGVSEENHDAPGGPNSGDTEPNPAAPTEHVPHKRLGWLHSERLDRAPWFLGVVAGLVAAFLALALDTAWRRKRNNPQRKASESREKKIKSARREMDHAIAASDAQVFFATARRALQTKWGGALNIAPEAIVGTDLPDPEAKAIFDAADSVVFSGQSFSPSDLAEWKQRTLDALKNAEK